MKKLGNGRNSVIVEMTEAEYSHILRLAGMNPHFSGNEEIDENMEKILERVSKTQLGRVINLLRKVANDIETSENER
jgi:hypothetical protein